MPRNGIAGSYGNCIFSFLKNYILFSIVAIPIYIPTKSVQEGSFFSTPSPAFITSRLFNDGNSNQSEIMPHFNVDLYFYNNLQMLNTFSCTFCHLSAVFGEKSIYIFCLLCVCVCCFLDTQRYELFVYFGD